MSNEKIKLQLTCVRLARSGTFCTPLIARSLELYNKGNKCVGAGENRISPSHQFHFGA